MTTNAPPGVYYDKVFKKEYLPSRIRYNQFFFYAFLLSSCYYLSRKHWGMVDEKNMNLGTRKYFTTERRYVNSISRARNS